MTNAKIAVCILCVVAAELALHLRVARLESTPPVRFETVHGDIVGCPCPCAAERMERLNSDDFLFRGDQ